MNPHIATTTLWLVLIALPAYSQRSGGSGAVSPIGLQITGFVRFGTNRPAENVLVRLEGSNGGETKDVQTDRSGRFTFTGLAGQIYEITVVAPGYLRTQERVDLQTDNTAFVQIQLQPDNRMAEDAATAGAGTVNAKIPDSARKEFEKARSTLNDPKKVKEAIAHLEKAISQSTNFTDAQLLLGTAYMDAGAWDKAESTLQQLLRTNPNMPGGLYALGEVYLRAQKYKDAEEMLVKGLTLDANSFRGHLALSRVYYATGDLTKAASEVNLAIPLDPSVPEAHLLAGNIFFKARQADKALPFFEQYLKLAPNGTYAAETRDLVARIKKALGVPI